MIKKPEILSPAGDLEKLKFAINFGADAVYCALKSFGMRAQATNFTPEQLKQALQFAHERKAKVYLTMNAMVREDTMATLEATIDEIKQCLPDAFIVSDTGLIRMLKNLCPSVPLHLSTQCSTVNSESCLFWHELGIERIVLARELSLAEIKKIRKNTPESLELEAFVHGAMCVSYSGRCLLSSFLTSRSANEGECSQPCRYRYYVTEEKRPDKPMELTQDDNGTYLFSSRDMCMIEHIPELLDAGIQSWKIEGRMKSAYYTAVTAAAYRCALEDSLAGKPYNDGYMDMLCSVSHREYDTGFYFNSPSDNANICNVNGYLNDKAFIATVDEITPEGLCKCTQRNKAGVGDRIRILSPGEMFKFSYISELYDENMQPIQSVPHPKMIYFARIPNAKCGDIIISV